MKAAQQSVRDFHEKFGLTVNDVPTLPDNDIRKLRANLINEEAKEFEWAAIEGDLVGMADALADLLYVVLGAGVSLGIDLEQVFQEVHRSNMTKVWPDGTAHRREDGKILKPPLYSPARIAEVILSQSNKTKARALTTGEPTH